MLSSDSSAGREDHGIAVVAIAFNEERDLPGFIRCLESWVDEIIIIDDGSSDRTCELSVSDRTKVRFVRDPRRAGEYFSDQRNKGIRLARCEWILHMDIDERVSPALAREILHVIGGSHPFDAFYLRRRNYFLHRALRGGRWALWRQVHLARRQVLTFTGMFHEVVRIREGANVGELRERIDHLNDASLSERFAKSHRYLEEVVVEEGQRRFSGTAFALLFYPLVEFLRSYFMLWGWRDGVPGLILSLHGATAKFRAHAMLWEQKVGLARSDLERVFEESWGDAEGLGADGPE